jgi:NAD-dependent deacetylase
MSTSTHDIPLGLADALRNAKHIAVLTGAGISAESGIPTFRDAQTGLWAQYDPRDLATPEAFRRNPRLVWEWYDWRRELVARSEPNAGHLALVELERLAPRFTLITQNIDGLHRRAGSQNIVALHGDITRTRCFSEDTIVERWADTGDVPPRCPRCGGMLRPDVVWFGEQLPELALSTAQRAALDCDLFLSIGTSGEVEPAASLPYLARYHGATLVVVNPAVEPAAERGYYALSGPAGTVLPALVRAVQVSRQ